MMSTVVKQNLKCSEEIAERTHEQGGVLWTAEAKVGSARRKIHVRGAGWLRTLSVQGDA